MKRGRPKKTIEISQTELDWIKLQNSMKFDEITSKVEYQIELGKKYYGTRWHTILEKDHHAHKQYKKEQMKGLHPHTAYVDRPIIQYDLNMKKIKTWKSTVAYAEENGLDLKAVLHIARTATSALNLETDTHSAYGYMWRFKKLKNE